MAILSLLVTFTILTMTIIPNDSKAAPQFAIRNNDGQDQSQSGNNHRLYQYLILRRKIHCSLNPELCSTANKQHGNKNDSPTVKPDVNVMQSLVMVDIPVMIRYPPCCMSGIPIGNCINCNDKGEDFNDHYIVDPHNPGR
ncbi:hypothetical protein DERF_013546 [Dermatophagoides farinae]|uniref:Transmembrane protein n=1 Tax=Dermatophagoides farinae TaxID=6954 RepID=A0A922HRE1_DERFA|nr:hypothetical protein DERF_013546 [Dermatophagoides farinae]